MQRKWCCNLRQTVVSGNRLPSVLYHAIWLKTFTTISDPLALEIRISIWGGHVILFLVFPNIDSAVFKLANHTCIYTLFHVNYFRNFKHDFQWYQLLFTEEATLIKLRHYLITLLKICMAYLILDFRKSVSFSNQQSSI